MKARRKFSDQENAIALAGAKAGGTVADVARQLAAAGFPRNPMTLRTCKAFVEGRQIYRDAVEAAIAAAAARQDAATAEATYRRVASSGIPRRFAPGPHDPVRLGGGGGMSAPGVCPCCGGTVDPLELLTDPAQGLVSRGGKLCQLKAAQFRVFARLVEGYPALVTRDELVTALIAPVVGGPRPGIKTIDVHISYIRRQVEDLGILIHSRWGVGYAIELGTREDAAALRGRRFDTDQRRRTAFDENDVAVVRLLNAKGMTQTAIAERAGLKLSTVTDILSADASNDRLAS